MMLHSQSDDQPDFNLFEQVDRSKKEKKELVDPDTFLITMKVNEDEPVQKVSKSPVMAQSPQLEPPFFENHVKSSEQFVI